MQWEKLETFNRGHLAHVVDPCLPIWHNKSLWSGWANQLRLKPDNRYHNMKRNTRSKVAKNNIKKLQKTMLKVAKQYKKLQKIWEKRTPFAFGGHLLHWLTCANLNKHCCCYVRKWGFQVFIKNLFQQSYPWPEDRCKLVPDDTCSYFIPKFQICHLSAGIHYKLLVA